MAAPRKYPNELRERAQRLVVEAREQDPELSLNAAVVRIGQRVGVNADTLRGWCKQAAIDRGERAGTTSDEAKRIKELERENQELKRANEILLAASSFFARELDEDRWRKRGLGVTSSDSHAGSGVPTLECMSDRDAEREHRRQVRDFLVSRRDGVTPAQAGLPEYGGTRRVRGLRREEVAMLAGVSTNYYVRMERGSLAGVSSAVLDGVANALRLDEAERVHLFALAGSAPRRARPAVSTVRPVIQQVLDVITDGPAWVRNGRGDVLAANPLARALYAPLLASSVARPAEKRTKQKSTAQNGPPNGCRFLYLDPAARDFFLDHDRMAQDAAASLRLEAGRTPHDADLITLVGELSTQSELFRRNWALNNVALHRSGLKRLRHPAVGQLDVNFETMTLSSDDGLSLDIYTADPDSATADGLKLLSSWAATANIEAAVVGGANP